MSESTNVSITNYYPTRIVQEEYRKRSVTILVKKQKTFSAGLSGLKDEVKKIRQDAIDIGSGEWATSQGIGTVTPEEEQRKISERMEKINNAGETIYGVTLPLPNELSDSQNHQWSAKSSVVSDIGNKVGDAGMAGISINKALGNFASSSGVRKPIVNPGYFQDYEGTEPREFSFSWDLIPDNSEEAKQIKNILYHFKKFTLPSGNGLLLSSPYTFDIQVGNDHIRDLMNMSNVVCKSMQINYGADGGLQMFPDGMPKYIKLDMTFAERATITAEVY